MKALLLNEEKKKKILPADSVMHLTAPFRQNLPQDINQTIRYAGQGKNVVLHIALDRATRHGQGPETMEAEDVRQGGLSLATLADLHRTFTGISPKDCMIHVNAGAENVAFLAMFAALFQANGIKISELKGTIGANPLAVLLEEGTLPLEMEAIYANLAIGMLWAEDNAPDLRTLLVDSSFYAKLGVNKADELALTLAEAIAYQRALESHGVELQIFNRHFEILLSGASEEENIFRQQIISEIWTEVMTAEYGMPYFALLEGSDSCYTTGALGEHSIYPGLKNAIRKSLQRIIELGGMEQAMFSGELQKQLVASRNLRLQKMAQSYAKAELSWPINAEQRLDTEHIKQTRYEDIVEYQKEIDEYEKQRCLAHVVHLNKVEDARMIDVAKKAFFAGATLTELIIALHTGRNDCYLENLIDCQNLLQGFISLRKMTEETASEYGREPELVICDIWQNNVESKADAFKWQKIFAPSGFKINLYQSTKSAEAVASEIVNLGARAVLLILPRGHLAQSGILARELKGLKDDIQIFVTEIGAKANNYVYPLNFVHYLTTEQTTCLQLLPQEII